jgi:pilus assembly protein FimV
MELYAARQDAPAFAVLAGEMLEAIGPGSEEWPKAVAMGRTIDPDNPLYGEPIRPAAVQAPVAASASLAAPVVAAAAATPGAGLASRVGGESRPAATVPAPVPDEVPPLDFSISVDTTIGRPIDEPVDLSLDQAQQSQSAGDLPGARIEIEAPPAEASADQSELERAIGGRFDLPSLDMEPAGTAASTSAPARVVAQEPPSFADLGDFRIDLSALDALQERGGQGTPAGVVQDVVADRGAPAPGSPLFAQWQEMATKLDLAAAYDEIGDKDGARELLEEVMRSGDANQQSKAKSMLSQLG